MTARLRYRCRSIRDRPQEDPGKRTSLLLRFVQAEQRKREVPGEPTLDWDPNVSPMFEARATLSTQAKRFCHTIPERSGSKCPPSMGTFLYLISHFFFDFLLRLLEEVFSKTRCSGVSHSSSVASSREDLSRIGHSNLHGLGAG